MVKTSCCPICATKLSKTVKVSENRYVFLCKTCNLRRLLPLPTKKELNLLYGRKEYYINELAELHNDLTVNYNKNAPIIQLYKKHLSIISSLVPPPGRLLEIGCARGVFLDLARKQGYGVTGIEMNSYAQKYAKLNFKLDVTLSDFKNYINNKSLFDIVVAYDVVEHVIKPDLFVKKICSILKPGGIMIIGTPDSDSFLYKISEAIGKFSNNLITYPLYRYYGRGIEHLTIFNKKNLKLLAKKHKFIPIQTYGYSIPANNITKVPQVIKPFFKYVTLLPNEFVFIAKKRL